MFDVFTCGETLGVVRLSGNLTLGTSAQVSLAGAESNVAIGLTRLGHRVAWAGCLGQDTIGDAICRVLRGEGIDISYATRSDSDPTGILVAKPASLGMFAVDYHRRGSAGQKLDISACKSALDTNPRIFHLTGITPALSQESTKQIPELVHYATSKNIPISFDINYRSRLWDPAAARPVLQETAKFANTVFGGNEELTLLTGFTEPQESAKALLALGVQTVICKSSQEATVYTDKDAITIPAYPTPVLNTIGAGDAFVAGYLSAWIENLDLTARLQRAHLLGAFAVSAVGDWEGLPSRAQLKHAAASTGEVLR